ncbi:aspartyl-phosphate phosphatase Spo0E family protein [Selenihalanaerobacter shriftii]|uniref:Spo0E like sporulation regulatory protein n=1 Tax=Selenihalanaerobacter shriftii TaxID=142842 RepID=A0A1T4NW70_9FIRM|nr:aspartyl-phosphate phosphatase Spo0E family protein [Selenihalanaerobacter shriftii]SJZ83297.1 Spo0E like sporulation regulatory protein [Selenihalanaerobacter shriftii]
MSNNNQLRSRIKNLKSELLTLATQTKEITSNRMVNKSQELDEVIVSFMKKELIN